MDAACKGTWPVADTDPCSMDNKDLEGTQYRWYQVGSPEYNEAMGVTPTFVVEPPKLADWCLEMMEEWGQEEAPRRYTQKVILRADGRMGKTYNAILAGLTYWALHPNSNNRGVIVMEGGAETKTQIVSTLSKIVQGTLGIKAFGMKISLFDRMSGDTLYTIALVSASNPERLRGMHPAWVIVDNIDKLENQYDLWDRLIFLDLDLLVVTKTEKSFQDFNMEEGWEVHIPIYGAKAPA